MANVEDAVVELTAIGGKQIDWDVRVWRLSPAGTEGTQTREQMLTYMKANYPHDEGWRVESVQSAGYDAGAINVVVFVARYE